MTATRVRSQSTTPKPQSPPPEISTSTSTSTLSPSSTTSSTTLPPINFNTNMFAQSSAAPMRDSIAPILPQLSYADVAQDHHTSPGAAPTYSSMITHPTSTDFYTSTSVPPYPSSTPTVRSMSIQSLVSTNNSSVDDDCLSVVSHTTTRNTDDDDADISVADIDDPDVRMAAEALGDLRADFVSSPQSTGSAASPQSPQSSGAPERQESMMEMIQGQNTILGTAVRAGRSVYRGGKRYSPRFKFGAEMVERAAAPMTSVVSYAARTTGVESVLRRNLESRRLSSSTSSTSHSNTPAHSQTSSSTSSHATKRRKTAFEDSSMDLDAEAEEAEEPLTHKPATDVISLNWQRRLMLNTAGVGVALSEESLKSLKYCLAWLRWANDHLDKVIVALRTVLGEYDSEQKQNKKAGNGEANGLDGTDERSVVLQNKIDNLRKDVIGTLKRVVEVVSTYAGGALPENARVVVKACITNLPRRWAIAAKDGDGTGNGMAVVVRQEEAGKRVLVLAKEGLEMLHQVSSIVQLTLQRAEEWCDRLGRKRPEDSDEYGKVGWEMEMEGVEEDHDDRKDK